jgi:hypothetical protein
VFARGGERLLDQQRDTGCRELLGYREMQVSRYGDDCQVDTPVVKERLDRLENERAVVHSPIAISIRIHGAGERDAIGCLEQPGVVPADHPEADNGPTQRGF